MITNIKYHINWTEPEWNERKFKLQQMEVISTLGTDLYQMSNKYELRQS